MTDNKCNLTSNDVKVIYGVSQTGIKSQYEQIFGIKEYQAQHIVYKVTYMIPTIFAYFLIAFKVQQRKLD